MIRSVRCIPIKLDGTIPNRVVAGHLSLLHACFGLTGYHPARSVFGIKIQCADLIGSILADIEIKDCYWILIMRDWVVIAEETCNMSLLLAVCNHAVVPVLIISLATGSFWAISPIKKRREDR